MARLEAAWGLVLISAWGAGEDPLATLRTQHATFSLDARGSLAAILRNAGGSNYLAVGQPAPVLSVRVDGKLHAPDGAVWDAPARRLMLRYGQAAITVVLTAEARPTHVRFEVVEVRPTNVVELVLWGPYPTKIGDVIGEVVGVVRNTDFALGIQTLNARTLAGYPTQENDVEADYTAEDSGTYPDLPAELRKDQLFRGDAARRTGFGSVLQAYCRNRERDRILANWGHEKYLAPAFHDGGVTGSKIALFAGPAAKVLDTLGAIEVAEGLPHPMLDGVWAKAAPNARCSYLIVDFSESTVERAIEMTRRAGLRYLYHSAPFETWGHFRLKSDLFPSGWDGLRHCVEKARRVGVRVGFHTLSNFITPNDPYVTPKPDPRLARVGTGVLAVAVDAIQRELPVAGLDVFRKNTAMNTVVIGDELVRYGSVSGKGPWRLLDCQRGAWGTTAAAHPGGVPVGRLMDHDYKVFLTDADLTQEVARHLAELCNHAGTLQISLDGLEGAWSTGMGQYGRTLFTTAWYDALLPDLRSQINDASNPGHFNWHISTRMNWGEPWYAGFRESQTLYRFKNQLFFERNLIPHMLGWFALRPDTSLEDAEWLLARAAGFDAGFTLAASLASTAQLAADASSADVARQFGATPAILEAVKQWETARMAGVFPPPEKALLRDNTREFHLEPAGDGQWNLFQVHAEHFTHDAAKRTVTGAQYQNENEEQDAPWILRSVGKQPVTAAVLEFNGHSVVRLEERPLPPGWSLRHRGGVEAVICDAAWREQTRVPVDAIAARLGRGTQRVTIGCTQQEEASLKLELRTLGPAKRVGSPLAGKPRAAN